MKQPSVILPLIALILTGCITHFQQAPDEEERAASRPASPIGFVCGQRNAVRKASALETAGQYNFGVFCYMDSDPLSDVMNNYLVGWYDTVSAYGSHAGCTTWGDPSTEGHSYWMYEGMGRDEYSGSFGGSPIDDRYRSNCSKQYLRYWDTRSATTTFYAYAPYIYGPLTAQFDPNTRTLVFPDSAIVAGYNDRMGHESMYAATCVDKQGYGSDVVLTFHRLNARLKICFWEDVAGYSVELLDLSPDYPGIYAAAGIRTGLGTDDSPYQYARSTYAMAAGASVNMRNVQALRAQLKTTHHTGEPLHFDLPTGPIGDDRKYAVLSPTTYYAIPRDTTDNVTGMTFHVSYRLLSVSGDTTNVYDATVHVPAEKARWQANTSYTYIFRISRNTNGTPGDVPDDIDPSDPDVPTGPNIYPIVFDNMTVETWTPAENEYDF